ANTRQERIGLPSTMTVQAPHTPCSHPTCVPVRPQSSRRVSASVLRCSTTTRCFSPFTTSSRGCLSIRCSLCSSTAGGHAAFEGPAHNDSGKFAPILRRRGGVLHRIDVTDGCGRG